MTFEEMMKAIAKKYPPLEFKRDNTVLLLIDMQKLALSDHIVWSAEKAGIDKAAAKKLLEDYDRRFEASTKQAEKLLKAFRKQNMTPIHVKIEAYAGDARDTGPSHKIANYLIPPGCEWGDWIEEVKPLPGEIVLVKTCSGAVVGTMLDKVLRNLNARNVITVGYYTDQCVETTVRDLADLGYEVILAQDATMTVTMKRYQNTMEDIIGVYARGLQTEELLDRVMSL